MKDTVFPSANLKTPCYVYDLAVIESVLRRLCNLRDHTDCKVLYSIKAANTAGLLRFIKPFVAGFSCSSLFELQLASEFIEADQTLHIATPGYRQDEYKHIFRLADYISINSISQWQRIAPEASGVGSCGIRINPELSFVNDQRYDPCRQDSKLGITQPQLIHVLESGLVDWQYIDGIHIHNNCESTDYRELQQTVSKVLTILSAYDVNFKWFNLGGGYLFNDTLDESPIFNTITSVGERYDAQIFIEPGKAVTGQAGYLVSTVIDIIEHQHRRIAILDTSINHLPEVFEYQYRPVVLTADDSGDHPYLLAGSSCLSGDIFGAYLFADPLELGSKIIFENVGAYMQVKANTFNGINLPACYILHAGYEPVLLKEHSYDTFRNFV